MCNQPISTASANMQYLQNQIDNTIKEAAEANTTPCYKSLLLKITQEQPLEDYHWLSLLFALASMPSINFCTAK